MHRFLRCIAERSRTGANTVVRGKRIIEPAGSGYLPTTQLENRLPCKCQNLLILPYIEEENLHSNPSILTAYLRRQPNGIELSVHRIPAAFTNVATFDGQAIALGPCTILLTNPVHAERVIISGLHLLLLVHVGVLSVVHLLSGELVACQAPSAEGWLLDVEGRETVDGGLRLDHVRLVGWLRHLRLGEHGMGAD